jgi:hypothetical protein
MDTLIERCAGLDVHKDTVVACVRVRDGRGAPQVETAEFGTTTAALLALRDWLTGFGVQVVGMESTGVYWKPVYYVLEGAMTCWLLNARHLRNVPGRKSAWNGRLLRQQDRGHPRAVEGATGSLRGADRVQRASCR